MPQNGLKNWQTAILLGVLLLAGIYLRFYHLGNPSFWVDEMNHVYAGMSLSDGEPPVFPSGVTYSRALIYSKLVGWSFSLFGVNEFAARLPSALFGILAIVLIFWVGQDLFNRKVGLIAAFFLTFAHPAIGWSRTSRMYTLFQLFFLLAVYLFYKGFEAVPNKNERVFAGKGWWPQLRNYFYGQGVRWTWLLASGVAFLFSLQVHQLTGLFAATAMAYFVCGLVAVAIKAGFRKSLSSKYFIGAAGLAVSVLIALTAFNLAGFVKYALDFHPDWARYQKVEDTHFYYWFLTSADQFPLAALFLLGCIQAFIRLSKPALFCVVVFVVPVFFHSFVFSYKIQNYVFNIYPFYLLIIAYGLHNLYENEIARLPSLSAKLTTWGKKWNPGLLRWAIFGIFVLWIPLTVWFRVAVKIPQIGPAGKNGAISHFDWRDASEFVAQHEGPDDVVLSTLPLTVFYYLGQVDYNLNKAHLDESLKWSAPATNGRHHEFYTGVPSIESVAELQAVMKTHAKGWVVADIYRLNREQYVPQELSQFIQTHLKKEWEDRLKTVVIYSWSR